MHVMGQARASGMRSFVPWHAAAGGRFRPPASSVAVLLPRKSRVRRPSSYTAVLLPTTVPSGSPRHKRLVTLDVGAIGIVLNERRRNAVRVRQRSHFGILAVDLGGLSSGRQRSWCLMLDTRKEPRLPGTHLLEQHHVCPAPSRGRDGRVGATGHEIWMESGSCMQFRCNRRG
jgi:hypothetical protein